MSSQSAFVAVNRPSNVQVTQINGCWLEDCPKLDSPEQRFQTCGRCREAYYCSQAHQKEDWKRHKTECGPMKGNVVRELAAKGLTPKDLGLVEGSDFVTVVEFQKHLGTSSLPTALILRFVCIDLPNRKGFKIKWDGKLVMGPLASMRADSPPSHWENYDALLEFARAEGSKSLGVVFIQSYQMSMKQSLLIDLNAVKIDHVDDWIDRLDDAFYDNKPIEIIRSA